MMNFYEVAEIVEAGTAREMIQLDVGKNYPFILDSPWHPAWTLVPDAFSG